MTVQKIYEAQDRQPWWTGNVAKGVSAVLAQAGADWEVERRPLHVVNDWSTAGGADEFIGPAPDHHALVHGSTLLAVVGSRFHPFQNREAFEFADQLGTLVAGSVLRDGRVVVATVKSKLGQFRIGKGSLVPYVHVANWHGGGGVEVHVTMVYDKTTVLTFPDSVLTLRHLKNLSTSPFVGAAEQFIALQVVRIESALNEMAGRTDPKRFLQAYNAVWGEPQKHHSPKGHATWRLRKEEISWVHEHCKFPSSDYGVFLAFNEWAQWGRAFRGTGGAVAKNDLLRAEEILFGQTRDISEKVFARLNARRK